MTGNKNEKTEVDEGTDWGGEEEDHPEPEKHKYLLVDVVRGQHTQIIADKKVSYLEAIALLIIKSKWLFNNTYIVWIRAPVPNCFHLHMVILGNIVTKEFVSFVASFRNLKE